MAIRQKNITKNHDFLCSQCGIKVSVYCSPSRMAQCPPRFCSLKCLGQSQKCENNPSYTGGRHKLANGYMVVLNPDHPNADSRGYVYEHRLVIEQKIGRYLKKGEIVHHIDHNRLNNDPNNLVMYSSHREHMVNHPGRNTNPRKGERHPRAKLSQRDVDKIRAMYEEGESIPNLMKKFSMCKMSIYNIVTRRSWKHE